MTAILIPCISCPKENNYTHCKHRIPSTCSKQYWKNLPHLVEEEADAWDRNSYELPAKLKRQRILSESKKIDNFIQLSSSSLQVDVCKKTSNNSNNSSNNSQQNSNVVLHIPKPVPIPNPNFEFKSHLNTYSQIVLNDMNKFGFCVIDNFLPNGDSVLSEVHDLYRKGVFRPGRVVNNKENSNQSTSQLVRSDEITWAEGNEPNCLNIGFLIQTLDTIVHRCNTTLASGEFSKINVTGRTKAMIACYPGKDTKYVRHIDNPNGDGRCITSIFYLNKNYDRKKHGGMLRLFPQMNESIIADIEPLFNRVVFFWSDKRNPHEVMPSAGMRFAITIWYLDENQRLRSNQPS